jgi:hypothetical protein
MLVDLLGGRALFRFDKRQHQFVAAHGERSPMTLRWFGQHSGFSRWEFGRFRSQGGADALQNLVDGGDGGGVLLAVG